MHEELFDLADRLERVAARADEPGIKGPLEALEKAALDVGEAWSGSWIGYHARVYYSGLRRPPSGARFSLEWGLKEGGFFSDGTVGDWVEYPLGEVERAIRDRAGDPDMGPAEALSRDAHHAFDEAKEEALSILSSIGTTDNFLERLTKEVQESKIFASHDFLEYYKPSGQFITHDMVALGQGLQVPPHFLSLSKVLGIRHSTKASADLSKTLRRLASHLSRVSRSKSRQSREVGTSVFIGHGRSALWRELKDYVGDRLGLPWDEFNRVPVAGVTNIERLTQMLNEAAIAFLVLTAEDEQGDGRMHARLNVVHEAGLFQGRLGFTKAIVLLEEGCEEFSNIQGLGQIRFPPGNIRAVFDEVRRVLEREGLIS